MLSQGMQLPLAMAGTCVDLFGRVLIAFAAADAVGLRVPAKL